MSEQMPPIGQNVVASFHYIIRNPAGETVESTDGDDPVTYLHGHNNILPALERVLEGQIPGAVVEVTLPPAEAYGERVENARQRVSKKHIQAAGRFKVGDSVALQTHEGLKLVTVVKIGHAMVDVDMNHPLAGQTLSFQITVGETRAATEEEIAHGHVHGPGGHHH